MEAGFSLIEMLVVLTILALVAALTFPLLARPSDSVRLQAAARDIVSALRVTRAAAIARSTNLALVIDVDNRTYESPVVAPRAFAADILARMKIAEPERATPARGGFRFFADGSSTGGDVTLTLGDKAERLCVDWLTGEARQGGNC